MFNVRLADDHLYGKWLFTWLSLLMSLMVSYFVLSFFPRDVLDWVRSGIELSQFLRIFLPAFSNASQNSVHYNLSPLTVGSPI